MNKIWFCRNCGYEVTSRGRCHACKARLSTSPLPELEPGNEEDEVGYRLQDWSDRSRARLIVRLIEANVLHRFEDDELVVSADDEGRTDDLVEEVTTQADAEPDEEDGDVEADVAPRDANDEHLLAEVEVLFEAARRLRTDPTDMQADSDLAHASATVFIADGFYGVDAETWAAIGRVTRRLLGALGADEALEEEITLQAGILVKLLDPLVGADEGLPPDGTPTDQPRVVVPLGPGVVLGETLGEVDEPFPGAWTDDEVVEPVDEVAVHESSGEESSADEATVATDADDDAVSDDGDGTGSAGADEPAAARPLGESVYELPEWLPEQRAQLSMHLDEERITHAWEGGDLVVPVASEDRVEALFDRIEGVSDDDDDGARYKALEDLFAAADRFVNDPDSRPKRLEVVRAVGNADGPTPLGLDDAQWWSIRSRARLLADSIEHDANLEVIFDEATTLRDMLRVLV